MQNVSTPAHANPPPEEDLISQLEGMESQGPGEATNWVADLEMRYIYDGRRVIQERNGNNTPTVSYTRRWSMGSDRRKSRSFRLTAQAAWTE